ncbi:hypothetical protein FOA52_007085 [Chlamydomonas sp. UWO 241]|nr:hypothetical protein FOA52_007085 [Chlamydomonas sp. UWO 241]
MEPGPHFDDAAAPREEAIAPAGVARQGDWEELPEDVLQLILGRLDARDLLSARGVCTQWAVSAGACITAVDLPLKALVCPRCPDAAAGGAARGAWGGGSAASLTRAPPPHPLRARALSRDPARGLISLSVVVSLACALTSLRRLVLCDYPVHPLSQARLCQWPGARWQLSPLTALKGLESLELRLVPARHVHAHARADTHTHADVHAQSPPDAPGHAAAAAAAAAGSAADGEDEWLGEALSETEVATRQLLFGQRALLSGLSALSTLSALTLQLLPHTSDAAHWGGVQGDQVWGESEDGSSSNEDHEEGSGGGDSGHGLGGEQGEEEEGVEGGGSSSSSSTGDRAALADLVGLTATLGCLPTLTHLRISHCIVPWASLARLAPSLPRLRTLSLRGCVQLSHTVVRALSCLGELRELELSQVRLVFRRGDAEDCPEALMNELYGVLGALPHFHTLAFHLDPRDETHYMHSAYLLGLYQERAMEEAVAAAAAGAAAAAAAAAGGTPLTSPRTTGGNMQQQQQQQQQQQHQQHQQQQQQQQLMGDAPGPRDSGGDEDHARPPWASPASPPGPSGSATPTGTTDAEAGSTNRVCQHPGRRGGPGGGSASDGGGGAGGGGNGRASLDAAPTHGLLKQLRSLELHQAVFDSDYTLMMLACLTGLTSLRIDYRTWPLSLAQHDLSLLAPLSSLRTLSLRCCDDKCDQQLLALTSRVLDALASGCSRLNTLQYRGPIVLESPHCTALARWSSLTNLSLSHRPPAASETQAVDVWRKLGEPAFELLAAVFTAVGATGGTPPGFLDGVVASIYKAKNAADAANYRPLTMLGSDYRILAKVLATRWTPLLSAVVGPEQTAFLAGRRISDNICLTQMLPGLLAANAAEGVGPTGAALALLDFRKAYDTIDRGFLTAVMEAVGVGDGVLAWTRTILTHTYAAAEVNGFISAPRKYAAGVRQGCPAAPALFLFLGHALACFLRTCPAVGVEVMPGCRVTCPQYADDCMPLLRSCAPADVAALVETMAVVGRATGLVLNLGKCGILPLGSAGEGLLAGAEVAGLRVLDAGVSLGVPVSAGLPPPEGVTGALGPVARITGRVQTAELWGAEAPLWANPLLQLELPAAQRSVQWREPTGDAAGHALFSPTDAARWLVDGLARVRDALPGMRTVTDLCVLWAWLAAVDMVFAGLRGLEAAVPTLWRMPLLNARKEPIWRLWLLGVPGGGGGGGGGCCCPPCSYAGHHVLPDAVHAADTRDTLAAASDAAAADAAAADEAAERAAAQAPGAGGGASGGGRGRARSGGGGVRGALGALWAHVSRRRARDGGGGGGGGSASGGEARGEAAAAAVAAASAASAAQSRADLAHASAAAVAAAAARASASAAVRGLLPLSLPSSLPRGLTSLSLTRVDVGLGAIANLGGHLPRLTSLTLEDVPLTWRHLRSLATDRGGGLASRLELLSISSTLSDQHVDADTAADTGADAVTDAGTGADADTAPKEAGGAAPQELLLQHAGCGVVGGGGGSSFCGGGDGSAGFVGDGVSTVALEEPEPKELGPKDSTESVSELVCSTMAALGAFTRLEYLLLCLPPLSFNTGPSAAGGGGGCTSLRALHVSCNGDAHALGRELPFLS